MARRKLLFRGTGTALVTPFKKDGSVDEVVLRELVDRQIKAGVEALVPVGSTGEGATLTEITKATGWQPHSVRGFLSGQVAKKLCLALVSTKREDGQRVYRIA